MDCNCRDGAVNVVPGYHSMETQQLLPPVQYGQGGVESKLYNKKDSYGRTPLTPVNNFVRPESVHREWRVSDELHVVDSENVRYVKGRLLGKGGFASVVLLTSDDGRNQQVAAKIISKRRIVKPEKKDKIAREIDIHRQMNHINVVQFIKFFEDCENVFILMENCGGMTLSKIVKMRQSLTEPEVRFYLRELLAGCQYIHSRGVVHRDLKLSNLFITEKMHLKIGDFGLSTYIANANDRKESICGTPNYISPEVINKIGHSFPADIWAIGCIIYALLSGRPPFETDCLKETYKLITKCKYNELAVASTNARHIIGRCLRVDPDARASIEKLKNDEFVMAEPTPSCLSPETVRMKPAVSGDNCNHLPGNANNVPIDALQYLVSKMDDLEICAHGGKKPSDFPRSYEVCIEAMHVVKDAAERMRILGGDKSVNLQCRASDQFVWITKWVDYSHKFGFGFLLSNNLYGACFKDHLTITINGKGSHVALQDPTQPETICCETEKLPEQYERRLHVMKYFVKYMDATLIKGGDAKEQKSNTDLLKSTFIFRWMRTKDSIIMVLNNGTVQVNWVADHTKLAVSKIGRDYKIMYINKRRQSSIYNLKDLVNCSASSEIRMRLKYIGVILSKLLNLEVL
ncbi:serine/threonine-protein kinase PLK1-like [Watersipora subatra]|uniref:serine/threonine-protein kinase PLK1-like n=1 Tax=Watersipora subatra TaxID=2589382 RepID=UPI00355B4E4A